MILENMLPQLFTAGNRAVSMPSDALILRSIQHIGSGGDRVFLEKRDTSFISEFNSSGVQGTPKYYANWNEFNIIVAPTPASADTVQINYIKDPPEFTSTNQTYLAKYQESMVITWSACRGF